MIKDKTHFLSVIIPAYKKEKTIEKDLRRIRAILEQIRYQYSMIVVVDGRIDRTYENARKVKYKNVKVLGYKENYGKGYAIRFGVTRSRGDYVAFIDSGMEIDPNGISMVLEHMEWYKADIIVGSKLHPASQVNYPLKRKIISKLYQIFVRFFTGLNVRDTQAGLKIYRRKILEDIFPRLVVKRYAFDLEMLLVAHYLGYRRIFEAPIRLKYNFKDLTHAFSLKGFFGPNGIWYSLLDTLAIIYRLRIIRYYSYSNRKNWIHSRGLRLKKVKAKKIRNSK